MQIQINRPAAVLAAATLVLKLAPFRHSTGALAQTQRSGSALTTTNSVVNGGFEAGQSPWQESTANGPQLIYTMYPHSGSHSAWFCGYTSCTDRLNQTVTLPPAPATLTFWVYETTQEPGSNYCHDSLTARVQNLNGAVLGSVLTVCNGVATTGWVLETLNLGSALGAYGGAQVQIAMQGTNDGAYVTSFFVDDVSLNVSTSSPATAPPTTTPTPRPTSTPTSVPVVGATNTPTPRPTSTPTSVPVVGATNTPTPRPTSTPTPRPTSTATSVPSTSGICPGSQTGCVQAMLNILNNDRAQAGVAPLALSWIQSNGTSSCIGSYGHSVHMAAMNAISHDQFPADVCIPWSSVGENVGMSQSFGAGGTELTDLRTIDQQMMSEPHPPGCTGNHACNILNPGYHTVGIGIDYVNNTTWLTEDFTN